MSRDDRPAPRARAAVAEVEALIEQRLSPLGAERVPFGLAHGRVLARDLIAPQDLPPHPRAAMDGFAVAAAAGPSALRVIGRLTAADEPTVPVSAGQAMRVMTGAPLPAGADAVVMVERARVEGDLVHLDDPVNPGVNVIRRGEDVAAGEVVLPAGRRLRPQDLAMAAALSILELDVARRPRVRVVPTGNELVPAGAPARGAAVVESSSHMVAALARRDGADVHVHAIARDQPEQLARALTARGADLVVIIAGSGAGDQDHAPALVRSLGELPVHGVKLRPGAPTGVGFLADGPAVLLAPGFPAATLVAWDLFGRAMVARLLGRPPAWPYASTTARLLEAYEKPADRVDVLRLALDGGGGARAVGRGGALLSTLTRADGFAVLPAGRAAWPAGAELTVLLYG